MLKYSVLLLFAPFAVAGPISAGHIELAGTRLDLVDAVAMPDGYKEIRVVASSMPFDRYELAEDSKLDSIDIMRLQVGKDATVAEFNVDKDGLVSCIKIGKWIPKSRCTGVQVAFSVRSAERIAGTVQWQDGADSAQFAFDLPIQDKLEPVVRGAPLPADGGEPGKAVLANFAAIASGDIARMRESAHPGKRGRMQVSDPAELKKLIALVQKMTPTAVSIHGGAIDGDRAWVEFKGMQDGRVLAGTAELERVDGRWFLLKTSTRS